MGELLITSLLNINKSLSIDAISCFGIPTSTLESLYSEVMAKRKRVALEILLSEIRQGDFQKVDSDEAISIIERYLRSAAEGVAKNNLRLLAKVIRGMASENVLNAHSFFKYASILSSLTNDEIRLLGIIAKEKRQCYESCKDAIHQHFSEEHSKQILQALLRTGLVYFTQSLESFYDERSPNEAEMDSGLHDRIPEIENNFTTNY